MPPACEIEPQYGIAWLKQSEQDCEIGIGARVWLDIGKGRAEQTTGAFDREPLDSVRGHAPTIVTCARITRSEEHTSELQSLMRISYAVFCLKKKKTITTITNHTH